MNDTDLFLQELTKMFAIEKFETTYNINVHLTAFLHNGNKIAANGESTMDAAIQIMKNLVKKTNNER